MPFIENKLRPEVLSNASKASTAPTLSYLIYREMKARWNARISATTAFKIRYDFVQCPDENGFLEGLFSQLPAMNYDEFSNVVTGTWEVFFNLVVLPYERTKQKENGDVE